MIVSDMTLEDWKSLGITQVVLSALEARIAFLKEQLSTSAGINPLEDRFKCGVIAGYEDILNIQLDEESHD